MSLLHILNKVGAELGIKVTDELQRALVVDKINEAAKDIYSKSDFPVSLKECFVRSTANSEIALPPFIGEVRAIRAGSDEDNCYCTARWELHTMWPKYSAVDWVHRWRNWRDKGVAAIAIEWTNTAPGTLEYVNDAGELPSDADGLIVTLVGETATTNNGRDPITIGAISQSWTRNFTEIKAIRKNKITEYNILVKDADGNEIAILYADQLETRYRIFDVSQYPTSECCGCGDGTNIFNILYKPRLGLLYYDDDSFPVDGFEDVIIIKTKQLFTELQEGKEQRALMFEAKADQQMEQLTKDKNTPRNQKLNFKSNPTFDVTHPNPFGSREQGWYSR